MYVAVGASDTVGVGADDPEQDGWVPQLYRKLPKGSRLVRLGVSGSTAEEALRDQVPRAEREKAELVTVWLAVNDFNALISSDDYEKTLTEILRRLRVGGAAVFLGNVPDLTLVPIYRSLPKTIVAARVKQYNQAIERASLETGAVLVDLFEPSKQLARNGDSLISDDGFHPSEEGYDLLAKTFWMAIENTGLRKEALRSKV